MHYFDYLKKTFVTKNDFYCKKEDQFSTVVSNSNLYADHILKKRIKAHGTGLSMKKKGSLEL